MERNVYVYINEDDIECFHNIKQLAKAKNLPYFSIIRAIEEYGTYIKDNTTVKRCSISASRKQRKFKNNAF